jgi:hypothetical protein
MRTERGKKRGGCREKPYFLWLMYVFIGIKTWFALGSAVLAGGVFPGPAVEAPHGFMSTGVLSRSWPEA